MDYITRSHRGQVFGVAQRTQGRIPSTSFLLTDAYRWEDDWDAGKETVTKGGGAQDDGTGNPVLTDAVVTITATNSGYFRVFTNGGRVTPAGQIMPRVLIGADALKYSIYSNKELLKKINNCLPQVFGEENAKKLGEQTWANSPEINGSVTSEGMKTTRNLPYDPPYAIGVGNEGGQFGTIYFGQKQFNAPNEWIVGRRSDLPGRSALQNAYVHELGNLLSYRASNPHSYVAFGKAAPPDSWPKDKKWDNDSGLQLQLCVFGN